MSDLTRQQMVALEMLARACEHPGTDDGVVFDTTFYDSEVNVAYIHWRTARNLQKKGLVEIGLWDPDSGSEITLLDSAS